MNVAAIYPKPSPIKGLVNQFGHDIHPEYLQKSKSSDEQQKFRIDQVIFPAA
jgi:hypothetical protein